ncbi:MAG: methyltransferase domain-containing protein [Patescibacteria group bacterium]
MSEQQSIRQSIENQEKAVFSNYEHLTHDAHLDDDMSHWNERGNLERAIENLPTHGSQGLLEIASEKKGQKTLDLGSGDNAVALSELVELTGVEGTGVTLPLEREGVQHPDNVTVVRKDVREFLRSSQPNTYGIIYSVQAWRYLADPLAVLKLAYRALKRRGFC